jgi:aldehyde:ferredoxin oxidoreductase
MPLHCATSCWFDPSTGGIPKKPVTIDLAAHYIGGRGYNAAMLWKMVPRRADPLGPDNILAFGVGPLTGTSALSSGRTSVTAKGSATRLYLKASLGGAWGVQLRYAGYSFVGLTGKATSPPYLWIDDDRVELRDAGTCGVATCARQNA